MDECDEWLIPSRVSAGHPILRVNDSWSPQPWPLVVIGLAKHSDVRRSYFFGPAAREVGICR